MEIRYERQMRHNYLIIKAEAIQKETYECRMLMANSIEGLLKFRFRQTETGIDFYYEITSRQPLSRILESRTAKRQEIIKLISSIAAVLERLENYLLQEGQILLEPEYIYTDPETVQFFFCLVPDRNGDFSKEMETLLQYLLKKTDHQDKESALLAYRLYQESQNEFYGIDSLLKWLPVEEDKSADGFQEDPDLHQEENQTGTADQGYRGFTGSLAGTTPAHKTAGEKKYRKAAGRTLQMVAFSAGVLLFPGLIWLLEGSAFFTEHWYAAAAWYGLWLAAAAGRGLFFLLKKRKEPDGREGHGTLFERREPDRFEEPEDDRWAEISEWEELREIGTKTRAEEQEDGSGIEMEAEEPPLFETRVLSAEQAEEKEAHCLVSLDKKTEDIPIRYFPFLIGKQSGIADYILMRDTVSRIHLKIEKKEGGYLLTDLNSTNGTWVRGRELKNNETVPLEEGDEIYIADCGFRFL